MTANIQVSGKAPDGRIYVVGGADFDEFSANLISVFGPEGADRLAEDFAFLLDPSSGQPSQSAAPSAPAAGGYSNTTNAPAPAAAPGAPTCAHGARTFRTGQGKKGTWTAWFCPQPKGSPQCEAIWG